MSEPTGTFIVLHSSQLPEDIRPPEPCNVFFTPEEAKALRDLLIKMLDVAPR